jgi:hypothetical protein
VVAEPLPVVVRSVETVEGRARLLRAARARGRAAEALRRASRTRLSASLGLGASPTAESVVDATSAHSGRAPAQVHALLYGADPPDDASLVRLASDLDRLETETYR